MRALERYVGPLMVFLFGFAFIALPAAWVKRGNFTAGAHLISKSSDPVAFWKMVTPLWVLGAVLMCFAVYLAIRISRSPVRHHGFRVVRWILAIWFIGWSVMVLIDLLR